MLNLTQKSERQKMTSLFVYGTLCFPEIVEKLTGKSFLSEQAILKKFQRKKVKDEDYPAIIKNRNSEVEGILLHNVDDRSMQIIAFYEGNQYRCEDLEVGLKEKSISAKVFVWNSGDCDLENYDWNLNEFVENSLELYLDKVIPETLKEFNSELKA